MHARTLQELAEEVEAATAEYAVAADLEADARRSATGALNRLNEAQKKFDAAVAEARKAAPKASDWKREEGKRVPA